MEFTVNTISGNIYHFFELEDQLRLLYNYSKEYHIKEVKVNQTRLIIEAYRDEDIIIIGPSSPISSIQIRVGKEIISIPIEENTVNSKNAIW